MVLFHVSNSRFIISKYFQRFICKFKFNENSKVKFRFRSGFFYIVQIFHYRSEKNDNDEDEFSCDDEHDDAEDSSIAELGNDLKF